MGHTIPERKYPANNPGGGSIRRLLAALVILLPFLAACGEEDPTARVDLTRRTDVTVPRPGESLTYAYLPQYSHAVSYERHHRMVSYLARETGYRFRQVFPATFDEHIQMVEQGEIDVSYSNPFVYIRTARGGARAFARVVEESGRPDFRSQILCRADNSAIHTLADCRGKRWIAVDPGSAGGFLFALDHFLSNGIRREDFAEVAFAPGPGGMQEKVIMAVLSGAYDIGSVRDGTLELVANKVDLTQIRILGESRSYPGWVFALKGNLAPAVAERIRHALLALEMENPEHAPILKAARIRGVLPSADAEFDPIRELASRVGVE